MLSYRHGFHAGGWADVHKHVTLGLLLAHLGKKATPFTVVDAYAGDAIYDLNGPEAQKTREFETGVVRIAAAGGAPSGVERFREAVQTLNGGGVLTRYPGSPALARAFLRDHDRMIVNELHPTAHRALVRWARGDRRISVHRRDATEFLGWITTLRLRRGLVLLDPAYEVKDEYAELPAAVGRALQQWPRGMYAIWYPVLADGRHRALLRSLASAVRSSANVKAIRSEIGPPVQPSTGLGAAGMVVINPPWDFERELKDSVGWLTPLLWPSGGGRHTLVPLTGNRQVA